MLVEKSNQSFPYFPHRLKYRNFNQFPVVEILRKGTVSTQFLVIHPNLCGNCAFPQNFHTRKLFETTVFYAEPSMILTLRPRKFKSA